jgi:hypothetical protein
MVTAGLLALWGILVALNREPLWLAENSPYHPSMFMTIWFGLFAVQSFALLQEANRQSTWGRGTHYDEDDDTPPWRQRR